MPCDDVAVRRPFRLGEWQVEPDRNLLISTGREVKLRVKTMEVLVLLACSRGEVVSHDELVASVWEGRAVTNDVLKVSVYELRKALGDSSREPRFIETVPGRGYRCMVTAAPCRGQAPAARRPAGRRAAAMLASLFVAAVVAAWGVLHAWPEAGPAAGGSRAGEIWPSQAEAYCEQATAMLRVSPFDLSAPATRQARSAVDLALALDPTLASAYGLRARLRLWAWDLRTAEEDLQLAIRLDPGDAAVRRAYAWLLSAEGRHVAARAQAEWAAELDPRSRERWVDLAYILNYARQPDGAITALHRSLELGPDFEGDVWWAFYKAHELRGDETRAFAYLHRTMMELGVRDQELSASRAAFDRGGLAGYYRSCAGSQSPFGLGHQAQCYARSGAGEAALETLEQIVATRHGAALMIKVDPAYQSLHGHPRFREILARVHPEPAP